MALFRAREEALDFKRLQMRWQLRLTAGLRRTRTAVSSVFLATAAGHCSQTSHGFCCCVGTLPTYGVRSACTGVDRSVCSAVVDPKTRVEESPVAVQGTAPFPQCKLRTQTSFPLRANPDVLLVQHIDEIIKLPLEQEVVKHFPQEWFQQCVFHQIADVLVPLGVQEIREVPSTCLMYLVSSL